jgi:hypothetical protein
MQIEVLVSSASAMSDISTFNPPLSSKDQVTGDVFRFMINLRPKLDQTTFSTNRAGTDLIPPIMQNLSSYI